MFAVFLKRTRWVPVTGMIMLIAVIVFSLRETVLPDEPPASGKTALSVNRQGDGAVIKAPAPVPAAPHPAAAAKPEEPAAEGTISSGTGFFAFLEPEHFRSVAVTATGYYAGPESTGKTPGHPEYGITFSGVKVRRDLFSTVAADPKIFPLGTILYIPGYGYGVVADTGNAIKGRKIDLYFETKRQVYDQWGKREVEVSVLRQGNGRLTEAALKRLNGRQSFLPLEGGLAET